MSKSSAALLLLTCAVVGLNRVSAQSAAASAADQDRQNMMDQLGIKALRTGPSGNDKAPNHANYDEAKANPYPDLPDPLTMNDGQKVTSAQMWWDKRRPEIVEDFDREVERIFREHGVSMTVVGVDEKGESK